MYTQKTKSNSYTQYYSTLNPLSQKKNNPIYSRARERENERECDRDSCAYHQKQTSSGDFNQTTYFSLSFLRSNKIVT